MMIPLSFIHHVMKKIRMERDEKIGKVRVRTQDRHIMGADGKKLNMFEEKR